MKSKYGQIQFKSLAANVARFLSAFDHFGTLCIKSLNNWSNKFKANINPTHATSLLLYPWKHQKTRGFSDFSKRQRKTSGIAWMKVLCFYWWVIIFSAFCLIQTMPAFILTNLWKHQKTSWFSVFQGQRKRTVVWNGLKTQKQRTCPFLSLLTNLNGYLSPS